MLYDLDIIKNKDKYRYMGAVLYKKCSCCNIFKNLETCFTKNHKSKDKRRPVCKLCRQLHRDNSRRRQLYKDGGFLQKSQYYQLNKDKILAKRREYFNTNYMAKLRRRIRKTIKRGFLLKSEEFNPTIGCTIPELFAYLKENFKKTYKIDYKDDYFVDLHIDHVVPLYKAENEQDLINLNHYTNLQFLYKTHNLEKSKRMDYIIPPFPTERYQNNDL